ncbi:unnamed protein product [Orchesella dallaii]|uniref:Uncharacterized protein n=1 Tax=Orchesella dallaii TaxID=48710 RepID=A0ABP1RWI8_9HEXA
MVLLLYLWENVKKWTSAEEMRGEAHQYYGDGKPAYTTDQDYQQMGGLRRLDQSAVRTHFYPEGGWGWIVCACAFLAHVTTSGAQLSAGALHIVLSNKFQDSSAHHWLGPLSWSVSSVCSPLVFNLCRRKNVRILSLVGGFLFPLSLFFTSFATELHQIFFSFGLIGGIGSCIVRESSGVVLGEYFRRRRQFVEQVVMAGTGVGVTLFSLLYLSFSRHLEWSQGFRIGAGLSMICILLPAFYRTANQYNPNRAQLKNQRQPPSPKSQRASSILLPLGGDICHSLNLFCVPALKPVLWAASISSFGLYAPVFLMSDFGRSEGLSGGSLLLLQTHLGLGLSLGVILGAILTLKKFQCCQVSPRMLCCVTCVLTGLSMIAISSVKGYYGYSLSAWIYGIALGSHLYTLKVLLMELTRTKHWGRIWSCVQSLMSPGILIGSGLTSYLGKPGFYACATCVLIGAGLIGYQLLDLTKCGSPQLSSSMDNDSPIPPAPPPISPTKYGTPNLSHALGLGTAGGMSGGAAVAGGLYPLRRSISLQQPLYPCCRGESGLGDYPPVGQGTVAPPYTPLLGMGGNVLPYSPYCRECLMTPPPYSGQTPPLFPQMIRSYSLPQTAPLSDSSVNLSRLKTTGTQTNPNSPVHSPSPQVGYAMNQIVYPGSFDRIAAAAVAGRGASFGLPEDRVIRDPPKGGLIRAQPHTATSTAAGGIVGGKPTTAAGPTSITTSAVTDSIRKFPGYKSSVMFASNPQLFPASATQSSATSTTEERSSSRGGFENSTPTPLQEQPQQQQHHLHNHVEQNNQRYLGNNYHHNHHHHGSSSRDYYPQREERRATFLRSQHYQRSFDSQKSADSTSIFPPVSSMHQGRFSVAVEQHKRPPHQKSQDSINNGMEPPKPPLPQSQSQKPLHQQPAFTRHYFDSSKIIPATKRRQLQQGSHPGANNKAAGHPYTTPTISAQVHQQQQQHTSSATLPFNTVTSTPTTRQSQQQPHYYPRWTQPQLPKPYDPFADDPDPPYYPAALSHAQTHAYHRGGTPVKISSAEFNVDPPKFNSLRRPGTAGSGSIGGGDDTTRGSSLSSQLNLTTGQGGGGGGQPQQQHHHHQQQQPQHHHAHHHQQQQHHHHHHHQQHHQPYLPPAPPIHPNYTPSRAQHYHPGAVPVYPPLAHHHPHMQQRHPLHQPAQHQQQQQSQHSSKNVSSIPFSSITKPMNMSTEKQTTKVAEANSQQQSQLDGKSSASLKSMSMDKAKKAMIHQQKSQQSDDDDVDAAKNANASSSRDDDDDVECMINRDIGPTIINLPPTIISGASPCPYCDVRRPHSSLSAGSRTTMMGTPLGRAAANSLSLSVPALQQLYQQQPPYYCYAPRPHYCPPWYRGRFGGNILAGLPPAAPPPNARFLHRRNSWHVPKDYLEQITTSV